MNSWSASVILSALQSTAQTSPILSQSPKCGTRGRAPDTHHLAAGKYRELLNSSVRRHGILSLLPCSGTEGNLLPYIPLPAELLSSSLE